MKKTNYLAMAAAAMLVAGSLIPQSQGAEAYAGQRPLRARWLERAKEELGLTADQVQKIKAELQAEKGILRDLISELHEARVGLRQAIQAVDASKDSVRAASAKVAAAETDLALERLKLYGRISPILTPEQLEKLKALRTRIDEAVDRVIDRVGERLGSG